MIRALFVVCCLVFLELNAAPKILIGIAGGTGSGKTTFAQKIHEAFPANSVLISQDSYYNDLSTLPLQERRRANFDHPNSLDFALLRKHLIELKGGRPIDQPIYSFGTCSREDFTHHIEPAEIIIVEGILLFAVPEVRDLFDLKIFIDTADDVRILRRIERDIEERSTDFKRSKEQYLTTVKPMHDAFVEPSKQYADVIVLHGGRNDAALGLVLAKVQMELNR